VSELYHPQCRVSLSIVFEGFGSTQPLGPAEASGAGPKKVGQDSNPTIIRLLPREAVVNLTGYKEADTWSLTFDAKQLPISPDLVRSMAVEIYMFDAGSVNPEIEHFANEEHLMVLGLADNMSMAYTANGHEVTCDGRDYTSLLIDKHWDPTIRIPTGEKISQVVQEIVDVATQKNTHNGLSLTVEYVSDQPEPFVGVYTTKTNKKGKPVKSGENAWDVIYKMVLTEGLIVFVRGLKVIITDPQTLTLQNANRARKVVYGRNLSSLKVDRKLGKEKVPQIEVTGYSSRKRGGIVARFPDSTDLKNKDNNKRLSGVGTKDEEIAKYVVHGVDDEALLKKWAESMYNSRARAEAKIHFVTKSLKDLTLAAVLGPAPPGGATAAGTLGTAAQDMLKLRAGDPIVIGFDPFNGALMQTMTFEQRFAYLRAQGYSVALSKLVAIEYNRIDQFKRPFYVRDVQVTWSFKEGITLDVEAVNYAVPARDDVTAKLNPTRVATKVPKSTDP